MKHLLLILLIVSLEFRLQAQSQQEMNQAAAADFEKADAELNVVYKEVLAEQLDEEAVKLLKAAQKAWVAFRDAEAAMAADEMRGGSMAPLLLYSSKARLTEERTKVLRSMLPGDPPEIPIVLPTGGKTAKAACLAFFHAYEKQDRSAASAVAVERALAAVNWDPKAARGAKVQFQDDEFILYEGGSMQLKTQKTPAGAWFVVDVIYTAD
jgi:uncharacterized protein YecT (DUF1311 family)